LRDCRLGCRQDLAGRGHDGVPIVTALMAVRAHSLDVHDPFNLSKKGHGTTSSSPRLPSMPSIELFLLTPSNRHAPLSKDTTLSKSATHNLQPLDSKSNDDLLGDVSTRCCHGPWLRLRHTRAYVRKSSCSVPFPAALCLEWCTSAPHWMNLLGLKNLPFRVILFCRHALMGYSY